MNQPNTDTCLGVEAVNMALRIAMEADPSVLVLGEDVGDPEGGGVMGATRGLSTAFGDDRCRSTPISEQAIIGAAIGASIGGFRPVAEIMLMNFTAVCMDMLYNHAAKLRFMSGGQTNVPITVRMLTGAGAGGGGQHADYLEAWFAHAAGMKVVAPSNNADLHGLLLSCIEDDDPCIFIENTPLQRSRGPRPIPGQRVPIGKAAIARPGADVTIVTHSRMVINALAAAEQLASEGVDAEVIDLRTISPWDKTAVLDSVAKTGRAVVVHEAVRPFGIGAEISATIAEELFGDLNAPVQRIGAPFRPVPFARELEDAYIPSAARIHGAAMLTMDKAWVSA